MQKETYDPEGQFDFVSERAVILVLYGGSPKK